MSGECVEWLDHPHFPYYRNPKPNLMKQIIHNDLLEKEKLIEINTSSLIFKLKGSLKARSLFINILIKEMIFEWFISFFLCNLNILFLIL
jgi:hypothetical protein